jgi:guanylate kinase
LKISPVYQEYYGIALEDINKIIKNKKIPVLEMNAKSFDEFGTKINSNGIYIKPFSYEALR